MKKEENKQLKEMVKHTVAAGGQKPEKPAVPPQTTAT